MNDLDRLIIVVKEQVELFLLEATEFYPFGSYLNCKNEVIPVGLHTGDDFPSSMVLIEEFEKYFAGIKYLTAIIAFDVSIKKGGEKSDAVQMQIMNQDGTVQNRFFKYTLKYKKVIFEEVDI